MPVRCQPASSSAASVLVSSVAAAAIAAPTATGSCSLYRSSRARSSRRIDSNLGVCWACARSTRSRCTISTSRTWQPYSSGDQEPDLV